LVEGETIGVGDLAGGLPVRCLVLCG